MQKLLQPLLLLICVAALSACQPVSPLLRVNQPDTIKVAPLPLWITEPKLQPTLTPHLHQILPTTTQPAIAPSAALTPA